MHRDLQSARGLRHRHRFYCGDCERQRRSPLARPNPCIRTTRAPVQQIHHAAAQRVDAAGKPGSPARWACSFAGSCNIPRMVGSIIPSSRFTIAKMLAPGRLGRMQTVRRIRTRRRHVLLSGAGTTAAGRRVDRDRHQPAVYRLSEPKRSPTAVSPPSWDPPPMWNVSCGRMASRPCRLRSVGPAVFDLARWRRTADRRGDPSHPAPRRRVSGLSVQRRRARFHGQAFRPHRQRVRSAEHPAVPAVLGLEGTERLFERFADRRTMGRPAGDAPRSTRR